MEAFRQSLIDRVGFAETGGFAWGAFVARKPAAAVEARSGVTEVLASALAGGMSKADTAPIKTYAVSGTADRRRGMSTLARRPAATGRASGRASGRAICGRASGRAICGRAMSTFATPRGVGPGGLDGYPRTVLVVGAGHIGSYIAAKMGDAAARAGTTVYLKHRENATPRPEVAQIAEASGVRLLGSLGSLPQKDRPDMIFVATKTYAHQHVFDELASAGLASSQSRRPNQQGNTSDHTVGVGAPPPPSTCAVFNGMVGDLPDGAVPCGTVGSWDFVSGSDSMVVRNETSPWYVGGGGGASGGSEGGERSE